MVLNIFYFHREDEPILTSIFFRMVGSTTNYSIFFPEGIGDPPHQKSETLCGNMALCRDEALICIEFSVSTWFLDGAESLIFQDFPVVLSFSTWETGGVFLLYSIVGWGFHIFLYIHPYLVKISNLTNIFSNGLKAPTRKWPGSPTNYLPFCWHLIKNTPAR